MHPHWLSHSALYAVGLLACLSTIKNAQEHRKRRPAVEKHTISDSLNVLWGLGSIWLAKPIIIFKLNVTDRYLSHRMRLAPVIQLQVVKTFINKIARIQ